ncbi:hypothetical protein GCM10022198_04220 [Klugiella xanthotipulae]|uniref:ABC transporter permease n=1 Tax=Klugiella xanthotipulae TaxID=244735 RepID=A0A543HSR5_9MICO|nr:hypothetical protein [Klugiella xanthotipulae]TQM61319.1 hypothetical protein FB466_2268 [Klugiella xanthotipulae]
MLRMVWGWVIAGIGAISAALLIICGTALGTWIDEQQVGDVPSVLGLLVVTALSVILFIDGLIVGLVGTARSRRT